VLLLLPPLMPLMLMPSLRCAFVLLSVIERLPLLLPSLLLLLRPCTAAGC
jgi:hypothetical protein